MFSKHSVFIHQKSQLGLNRVHTLLRRINQQQKYVLKFCRVQLREVPLLHSYLEFRMGWQVRPKIYRLVQQIAQQNLWYCDSLSLYTSMCTSFDFSTVTTPNKNLNPLTQFIAGYLTLRTRNGRFISFLIVCHPAHPCINLI